MPAPRVIAWIEPEHRAWLESLVATGEVTLVGLGSPRGTQTAALAEAFGVDAVPDIRHAALHGDAEVLWLAARAPLDDDERRSIREANLPAVSSEPRPLLVGDADTRPVATFIPHMRRSPGWLAARDAIREFGPTQAAAVMFRGGGGHGSLLARLFDALDVIDHTCGGVEQLDAALAGVLPGVPADDASLSGHLTVNLRFPDRRCAAVMVSDTGGTWSRRVVLLGAEGALTITDTGFRWERPDGSIDEHVEDTSTDPGHLIARQVTRLLQGLDANDPPPDTRRLMALCETARLSARTGQSESPSRMADMMTRV